MRFLEKTLLNSHNADTILDPLSRGETQYSRLNTKLTTFPSLEGIEEWVCTHSVIHFSALVTDNLQPLKS